MSSSSVGAAAAPRTQAPHAPNAPSNKVEGSHEVDRVEGKRGPDLAPKPHVGKDDGAAAGNQGLSNMSLPGQNPQTAPTTSEDEDVAECSAIDALTQGCEQNVFDSEDVVYRDVFSMD